MYEQYPPHRAANYIIYLESFKFLSKLKSMLFFISDLSFTLYYEEKIRPSFFGAPTHRYDGLCPSVKLEFK